MCVTRTRNGEAGYGRIYVSPPGSGTRLENVRLPGSGTRLENVWPPGSGTRLENTARQIYLCLLRSYNQKEQLFQPAAGDSINVRLPGCGVYLKNGACQVHKIHPVTSRAEKLFPFSVTPKNS